MNTYSNKIIKYKYKNITYSNKIIIYRYKFIIYIK